MRRNTKIVETEPVDEPELVGDMQRRAKIGAYGNSLVHPKLGEEEGVQMDQNRRSLLRDSLVTGVAIGAASIPLIGETFQKSSNAGEKEEKEPEVTATEDLMREHGVIRRALLVYIETAPKLRQNASGAGRAAHFSRD